MDQTVHIPILLQPIVSALIEPFQKLSAGSAPHYLVDCTLGGGGHSGAFLEALSQITSSGPHRVLSIDRDPRAVEAAKLKFQDAISAGRMEIYHRRFSSLAEVLEGKPVLGLLADLGFSSDQMDDPSRGLSFHSDGALDMRLDSTVGQTCADLLKSIRESDLEELLQEGGEDRFAKQIAAALVSQRRLGKLPQTPRELSLLIVKAIPAYARHGRIHAATRAFQALRIAVNEELKELDHLLREGISAVKPGGRIAILSFHSLEDRRAKERFKDRDHFMPLFKKPIQADDAEVRQNPRSRSAKLRVVERVGEGDQEC